MSPNKAKSQKQSKDIIKRGKLSTEIDDQINIKYNKIS